MLPACLLFGALLGCPTDPGEPAPEPTPDPGDPIYWPLTIGPAEREAAVKGPEGWRDGEPIPVVVLLHGYSAWGEAQELLWGLSDRMDADGFALVLPDGTIDDEDNRFWNATPACCGWDSDVDDVGYLLGLIDDLASQIAVDLDRVYFTGHSNGHFMSYRMACDAPDRVAAIAGLAGSGFLTEEECAVGDPVPVLHLHGDQDGRVPYEGRPGDYPSAPDMAARWAERAGCDLGAAESRDGMDLTGSVDGAETEVLVYQQGCDPGVDVQLWTMVGAEHVPIPNDSFAEELIGWLLSHSLADR